MKATEKSEAWGRGLGAFLAPCSLLPCPARPGGLSTSRGVLCVCVRVGHSERGGASLSLSLGAPSTCALSPPSRPPAGVLCTRSRKVCVDGMLVREKALGGVLERGAQEKKSMR